MKELFFKAKEIHRDLIAIRISDDYLNEPYECYLVFPQGDSSYEMNFMEFIPESNTDLWFYELYNFLEDSLEKGEVIKPGYYSF
jgi:hypothetical protein